MKTIFEKSNRGRGSERFSSDFGRNLKNQKIGIESNFIRDNIGLPEVDEQTVARHYTLLSQKNFGVDSGFYPLGSCTMKYNPKINEKLASNPKFLNIHPYMPESSVQGSLQIMYELTEMLKKLTGMDEFSLVPGAGAHGEFLGIKVIKAYHEKKRNKKYKVIVPDTAHGTNPSSCNLAGFEVVNVKTEGSGILKAEVLEKVLTDDIAALMMTNPNTLGLFESDISTISELLHSKDALLYCDGANFNALMGTSRFSDMGVDVIHLNLHKTFSTPHGGGGPGSGPVGVRSHLKEFFPNPRIIKEGELYRFQDSYNDSIGRIKSFYGNFGIFIRAYSYLRSLGPDGVRRVSEIALLNANYMRASLKDYYHIPFPDSCMHEVIISDKFQKQYGVTTLDIAKRLIDKRFHPPTIYFPLVVPGAMMIEPVESESKETIDAFIKAMIEISKEVKDHPELLKNAPLSTSCKRLDEVSAARVPVLSFKE